MAPGIAEEPRKTGALRTRSPHFGVIEARDHCPAMAQDVLNATTLLTFASSGGRHARVRADSAGGSMTPIPRVLHAATRHHLAVRAVFVGLLAAVWSWPIRRPPRRRSSRRRPKTRWRASSPSSSSSSFRSSSSSCSGWCTCCRRRSRTSGTIPSSTRSARCACCRSCSVACSGPWPGCGLHQAGGLQAGLRHRQASGLLQGARPAGARQRGRRPPAAGSRARRPRCASE